MKSPRKTDFLNIYAAILQPLDGTMAALNDSKETADLWLDPDAYPHQVQGPIELHETHIRESTWPENMHTKSRSL